MPRRLLPLLILLLLPSAHAGNLGQVEASALQATNGDATAALAALETDPRATTGEGAPVGAFSLTAERLRLEMDWSESTLRAAGIASDPRQGTAPVAYQNASLASTAARGYSYLFLAPWQEGAKLRITTPSLAVVPHEKSAAQSMAAVTRTRESQPVPIEGAAAFHPESEARLIVEGSFLLVLWDVDFNVKAEEGDVLHWTGERMTPIFSPPGHPGLDSEVRRQQAYLFVHEGRLDLQWQHFENGTLYAGEAALASNATAVKGAVGLLRTDQGTLTLSGQDVRLQGPAHLTIGRQNGAGFALVVERLDGAAVVNGQSYLAPAAAQGSSAVLWWLAPVVVVALLFALRNRGQRRRLEAVEAAVEAHRLDDALDLARPLLRGRQGHRAVVPLVAGLLRQARAEEALAYLEGRARWPKDWKATRAFLLAHAKALLGQRAAARRHLQDCLALAAAYYEEALKNPVLRPFVAGAQEDRDRDVA